MGLGGGLDILYDTTKEFRLENVKHFDLRYETNRVDPECCVAI